MQKLDDVMDIAHITRIKGLGFRFVLGFELAPNRNLPIEIKNKKKTQGNDFELNSHRI